MKKVLILMFMVVLVSGVFAQDDTQESDRKNAVVFKPLILLVGAIIDVIDIAVEYQRAFGEHFVLTVMPEIALTAVGSAVALEMGAVFFPLKFKRYLHGFYLGVYPKVLYSSGESAWSAAAKLGFQWALPSGFIIGLGGGAYYASFIGVSPLLDFGIGFSF